MLEEGHQQSNDMIAADDDFFILASFDDLSDVLPNILGFLPPKDIMRSRRTNKKMMNAARITVVPPCDFCIDSLGNYNTMRVMTTEMPNLQQITLHPLDIGHKYADGEDPDEEQAAETAHYTSHDIQIISNFSKLVDLKIQCGSTIIPAAQVLNGRYPFLFNSFPLLQKLRIHSCRYLKWDLGMLAGLPLLKEINCCFNGGLTGNIKSLRVLKDTLEKVDLHNCSNVEGNFMDLADFPYLEMLNLEDTAVTGDIRDIGENDFSSLSKPNLYGEVFVLPEGVYGGTKYKLQRISEGPDLVKAVYLLKKQHPALNMIYWYCQLSLDSPDWYRRMEGNSDTPPFYIYLVQAGSRIGYRWGSLLSNPCEVNWLDPEPDRESSEYAKYMKELQVIESQVNMYRGFHQPPTQEEYTTLVEEHIER